MVGLYAGRIRQYRKVHILEKYVINGATTLHGEVEISGAKNAAVAIIPAALMVDGVCCIENIPQISDTDMLLTILKELGAKIRYINKSTIEIDARNGRLHGARIYLDKVSVGATMNIIIAAALAQGRTIIENAAREPHIVDLANFLNSMGADIRGAGTDTVKINGVDKLHGGSYAIIPDQIEAGTYMVAAAATGGEVLVKNVIPRHLECISAKLRETGTIVQENEDSVLVKGASTLRRVNVKTLPYPGFPTDMQPPMGTLLCLANGTSVITEGVYDNRFKYMNELRKMGAEVQVDGRVAVIEGGRRLTGALVQACDLRAGAAMVIAGMCAVGTTIVEDIHYIERGYEDFVGKLNALGADIKIVDFPDNDDSEKIISVV